MVLHGFSAAATETAAVTIGTTLVTLEFDSNGKDDSTAAKAIISLNTALTAAGSNVVASADGAGIKFVDSTGANITVSGTTADLNKFGIADVAAQRGSLSLSSTSSQGIQVGSTVDGGAASNTASGFTTNSATAQTNDARDSGFSDQHWNCSWRNACDCLDRWCPGYGQQHSGNLGFVPIAVRFDRRQLADNV